LNQGIWELSSNQHGFLPFRSVHSASKQFWKMIQKGSDHWGFIYHSFKSSTSL
jgi:hypothetical protein